MRRSGFLVQRSWLRFAAAVWLFAQVSIVAATPASMLAHAPQAADAVTCTCSHTGHDECPMHHPKSKSGCQCRSTQDPDAASLVSLLGPIAVMPHAVATVAEPPITQFPGYLITRFIDAIAPPDGPPPRA